MYKKAFTLFEVLISLILLSLVFMSVSKVVNKSENIEVYNTLLKQENNFYESKSIESSEKIKFYNY